MKRAPSLACALCEHRDHLADALLSIHHLQHLPSITLKFRRSYTRDRLQRADGRRPQAGDMAQRLVVKHQKGSHAFFGGDPGPESAQPLEEFSIRMTVVKRPGAYRLLR